jgi:hypothetical protein
VVFVLKFGVEKYYYVRTERTNGRLKVFVIFYVPWGREGSKFFNLGSSNYKSLI